MLIIAATAVVFSSSFFYCNSCHLLFFFFYLRRFNRIPLSLLHQNQIPSSSTFPSVFIASLMHIPVSSISLLHLVLKSSERELPCLQALCFWPASVISPSAPCLMRLKVKQGAVSTDAPAVLFQQTLDFFPLPPV